MKKRHIPRPPARLAGLTALIAVSAALLAGTAGAAAPAPTLAPQVEGNADTPFVGDTLTATTGRWSNTPTSFAYQWLRCDALGDRKNCAAIAGATKSAYTVAKADVGHTLAVRVTATNSDGSATQGSKGTGIVSDTVAPKNYVRPVISGNAAVGETLTATPGTWAGATSFSFQWQQCDAVGATCTVVAGATGRTYGVRATDIGHTLRIDVTASNKYGKTQVTSDRTDLVTATPTPTTTTVVTTTVAGNRAPSIAFLSLKRVRTTIYARFRVCDDSAGRLTVIERDHKARQLAYTRKFGIRVATCATTTRHWLLIPRFRSPGRFVVTLRAQDASGRLSRLVSRGLTIR